MTTYSPILNMPQVAANQSQKEATINTAQAIMEASYNSKINLSLVAGNRTLTTDEATRYFHQIYTGQTAARQVTIRNTARFFAVTNDGSYNITLKCNGSSGATLVVTPGKKVLVLSDGTDVTAITSGVNLLSDLTDVVGADGASEGQLLGFVGGNWEPVESNGDQSFFVAGTPSSSQKVLKHVFTRNALFYSDFSQSQAHAGVVATAAKVFNVYKNASLVGTISFAIGSATATFSTDTGGGSSTVTFSPGDFMLVVAPASADATLADISVTLKGLTY